MKFFSGWFRGGLLLAVILTLSILLIGPFGVATPMGAEAQPEGAQSLNYRIIFLISVIAGGFAAARISLSKTGQKDELEASGSKHQEHGAAYRIRLVAAGFLVLFGASLADGTASEHMLSGLAQTSVSGYLFVIATFLTAIPLAMILYGRGTDENTVDQQNSSPPKG